MTVGSVATLRALDRAAGHETRRSPTSAADERAGATFERLLRERDERSRSRAHDEPDGVAAVSPPPRCLPESGRDVADDAGGAIATPAGAAASNGCEGAGGAAAAAAAAGTARHGAAAAADGLADGPAPIAPQVVAVTSATQAAMELALAIGPPVDAAPDRQWSISVGQGIGPPLTLTATRVAGDAAGGAPAWALQLQAGRADRVASVRHAARLEDRLWAQAIPARVTVDGDEEHGDEGGE